MSRIHSTAIVEDGATLGADVSIGPGAYVGPKVVLGNGVTLHPRATVLGETTLGDQVTVHTGAVLGDAPQILGVEEAVIGRLEVGARTVIRENATLHAGWLKDRGVTTVGADCLLMVNAHVGHDASLGDNCVIANNVPVAGHCMLGDAVWVGGQAAMHQFTRIGRGAMIGGGSILVGDVIPFGMTIGNRARLNGLNITGLKRRGADRETLRILRAAYRALFEGEGRFTARLEATESQFSATPLVMEIIDFIKAGDKRPLCQPD